MCNVSVDSLLEDRDTSGSRTFLYVTMVPQRITLHTAARGEWQVAVLQDGRYSLDIHCRVWSRREAALFNILSVFNDVLYI